MLKMNSWISLNEAVSLQIRVAMYFIFLLKLLFIDLSPKGKLEMIYLNFIIWILEKH